MGRSPPPPRTLHRLSTQTHSSFHRPPHPHPFNYVSLCSDLCQHIPPLDAAVPTRSTHLLVTSSSGPTTAKRKATMSPSDERTFSAWSAWLQPQQPEQVAVRRRDLTTRDCAYLHRSPTEAELARVSEAQGVTSTAVPWPFCARPTRNTFFYYLALTLFSSP